MRRRRKLVIVGSANPVKAGAVKSVFKKVFSDVQVKAVKTDSGIAEQPKSFEEGYKGALNRAENCLKKYPQADYFVGLEGANQRYSFGWTTAGVVVIMDRRGKKGVAVSSQLLLPNKIIRRVNKGKELGLVIEEISGVKNIKQKQGAFGFFTNNRLTRQRAYEQAIIFSLARFIKEKLYD